MNSAIDFDWKWLIGLAIAAVLARVWQMGKEVDDLRKQLRTVKAIQSEPFPSETTEESQAIRDAKALAKKMGDTFTFGQAYKAVKKVRDEKKAREIGGDGDSGKRTA